MYAGWLCRGMWATYVAAKNGSRAICFVRIAGMANGNNSFIARTIKKIKREPKLQTLLYGAFFAVIIGIILIFLFGSLLGHSPSLDIRSKPI
jgi:hypothetical protein